MLYLLLPHIILIHSLLLSYDDSNIVLQVPGRVFSTDESVNWDIREDLVNNLSFINKFREFVHVS